MEISIDLHCHSTHSDGSWTVEELLIEAEKKKIKVFAISDHDNLDGSKVAFELNKIKQLYSGILIPAIEISTVVQNNKVHLLAFFPNLNFSENSKLIESLYKIQNSRKWRMNEMIKKANQMGFNINIDDVLQEAAGTDGEQSTTIISRPHLARVMIKKQIVNTMDEAFDNYLAEGKPLHVERFTLTYKQWIDYVHQENGTLIWAHPLHGRNEDAKILRNIANEIINAGIDGIEREYIYKNKYPISKEFEELGNQILDEFINKHDLLISAGGDFHGDIGHIGDTTLVDQDWEKLKAKIFQNN